MDTEVSGDLVPDPSPTSDLATSGGSSHDDWTGLGTPGGEWQVRRVRDGRGADGQRGVG